MPRHKNQDPEDTSFVLTFGGGVNSRKLPQDIDATECVDGENLDIDVERGSARRRPTLTRLATLPGGVPVDGYAVLDPPDLSENWYVAAADLPGANDFLAVGPIHLYQSGTDIFIGGFGDFTPPIGNQRYQIIATNWTVDADARLRGTPESYVELTDATNDGYAVIITDLSLVEEVKVMRIPFVFGVLHRVHFDNFKHNIADTEFYARYCHVELERAWFTHVRTNNTVTVTDVTVPHMIVGSKVEEIEQLTITNRPSSSLGEGDPFYVLAPDLRPINGVLSALGSVIVSTERGRMFILTGSTAKDFDFTPLFANSGATGDEAVTFAGNDVAFYREGIVESLAGSEAFGDVETDDFSRAIKKELTNYKTASSPTGVDGLTPDFEPYGAQLHYDQTTKQLLVYRPGDKYLWAMAKSFHDKLAKDVSLLRSGTPVSGWMKWTTKENTTDGGVFSADTTTDTEAYFDHPVLMFNGSLYPAADNVTQSSTAYLDELVVKTTFFTSPIGEIFYLDSQYDNTASYRTSNYFNKYIGQTDVSDPAVEQITCKRKSKVLHAPSGMTFENITARIYYIPRHTIEPVVKVSVYYLGSRRRKITKDITLSNWTTDLTGIGEDDVDMHERSLKTSFQGGEGNAIQIEIEWDDYLVEITRIEFNAKA